MTSRFLPFALVALLAVAATGCNGAGSSDAAGLDSLATGDPADLLAYNAGFETAGQLLDQDSTFNFDRFREGFAAGVRGDSSEIAYALGLRAGLGLHADTISNINPDLFLAGIRERAADDSSRVTPEQVAEATTVFQDTLTARQVRAQEVQQMQALRTEAATNPAARARLDAVGPNLVAARRFLAGAERRPGHRKSASGLIASPATGVATGPAPTPADMVSIRYIGKLADGSVFDQSQGTAPVQLPVGQVVPGFAEALQTMRPGQTRTFFIPPGLAYGALGSPGPNGEGGIPPNAALEFQITLVEIVPQGMPQGMPQGFPPPGAQ